MSRPLAWRALLALAIIAGSIYVALTQPAKLGLDLRGGTQIVLETRDGQGVKANRESTDRALEVLRKRVDALGVAESSITRSGDRRIIVELPDVQDPKQAADAIGRTAQLTAHPVRTNTDNKPAKGEQLLPDEDGRPIMLRAAALSGAQIGSASASFDQQNLQGWYLTVDFRGNGGKVWEQITAKAACQQGDDRRIAFVLDGKVISSPSVQDSVPCNVGIGGGSTQITGQFSAEEAKELAALIQGGSLPVPVSIIEQRVVGPTLGEEAIEASWQAAVFGIALTGLFIIWMYRLVGFLATVALATYGVISYAALVAMGATLTLPGLAGFVLAIGMAVDANVLVFERAKEEYAAVPRRGTRPALVIGFQKAWSAIADSNITTLLAAGLLFFLAAGPVRGFGVTLTVGVLASMISALVITRVLAEWAVGRRAIAKRPGLTGLGSTGRVRDWLDRRQPDVMRRKTLWLTISGVMVAAAFAGIIVKGFNFGVEFTGGRQVVYNTSQKMDINDAREAVAGVGFPRAVVQTAGKEGDDISVRTEKLGNTDVDKIQKALSEKGGGTVAKERDELIGPSLGSELRQKALIALGVALLAQLAYLAFRFRLTFGAGAVLAMFHDVIIVAGVFAWLGKPIDGVFLAAMLTIIGYSVNDSVVVFDRIRELWRASPEERFSKIANRGALQTVPRTVNTGMGAVFILAALALLGGDSLTDFAIALLLGILVGTWSSVFTATPLAIVFQGRSKTKAPKPKAVRRPAQRQPGDSGAVV
ncbi:protein translocase subunit secF /protein translocase subunit secD [Thermomonospora echinospora]|uniref:Multifunctional fusion protein n=1 Tax=Thermomonospora echinospora TaxID=1992 RepID=A0A1H6BIK2_9ACTN|nr:protein translocase subunit SecD [Thermomonospora echinospora]SEG60205.1 protein translocase subunit secF /protein translocase subunit secD [Thermomonospora echinospora]